MKKLFILILMTLSLQAQAERFSDPLFDFVLDVPSQMPYSLTFQKGYLLGDHWRFDDGSGLAAIGPGNAIVEIFSAKLKREHYPRYLNVSLRIGRSDDKKSVEQCLQPGPLGKLGTEEINGVTFHIFPIKDAAMMNVLEGKSYRTVHRDTCYALEIIKAYSNYREGKASEKDLTQTQINAYLKPLNTILASFRFKKASPYRDYFRSLGDKFEKNIKDTKK